MAVMEDVTDIQVLARHLASLLKLDQQQVAGQLENAKAAGQYQVRLRGNLTWEEMALVATYQPELPGVQVQIQPKREYRQNGLAAHVLGYLGEITEAQLKSGKFANYKVGDYVGRCGIELAWDKFIRGARGYRRIEVDAYGREFRQLDSVSPTSGDDIYLTLDNRLQKEAEACLDGMVGAIVALDPAPAGSWPWPLLPAFPRRPLNGG